MQSSSQRKRAGRPAATESQFGIASVHVRFGQRCSDETVRIRLYLLTIHANGLTFMQQGKLYLPVDYSKAPTTREVEDALNSGLSVRMKPMEPLILDAHDDWPDIVRKILDWAPNVSQYLALFYPFYTACLLYRERNTLELVGQKNLVGEDVLRRRWPTTKSWNEKTLYICEQNLYSLTNGSLSTVQSSTHKPPTSILPSGLIAANRTSVM